MKLYEMENLRNLGVVGHGSSGKTSLVEALLFCSKATNRLGKVEDGSTISDFDEDEIKRQFSINSSLCHTEWQAQKINIVDTPGFGDFIPDALASIRVVDSVLMCVCAVSGVEVFTEKLWSFASEVKRPVLIFINKMDRERASFERTYEDLANKFGPSAVPIQYPIGSEQDFKGMVDLLSQKAYIFEKDASGNYKEGEIPANITVEVAEAREKLIEVIAEGHDELLEKYLEGGELTPEELLMGLKKAFKERSIFPILCGSASHNIGPVLVLQAIIDYFPSPADFQEIPALDKNDQAITIKASVTEPLAAFVFKTIADPYAGKISLFRVYSGSFNSDSTVYNVNREVKERIGQVLFLQGKKHVPVEKAIAGELAAIAKLKETFTGDTLCLESKPVKFSGVKFPKPLISYAVQPKAKGDEDKISTALQRLCEEDLTIKFARDARTKEFLLSGMGQEHVEVIVGRLKRKFGVEVELTIPKVPYFETIKGKVQVQGKYKRQTGGRGQYGDTWLELEPLPRGQGFEFANKIFGGVIPRQYVPAVEKGVIGAMEEGILAGYPVTDIKVTLYDGSFHPVDSSEMAFKIAGSLGFKKGFVECNPFLLEPIMNVEVMAPEACMGDIIGDLNSKRGKISGVDSSPSGQIIKAQVPMAEMLKYAPDLRSMTQGRGTFTMEVDHYEEVPAHLAQKIIDQAKKVKEEEK